MPLTALCYAQHDQVGNILHICKLFVTLLDKSKALWYTITRTKQKGNKYMTTNSKNSRMRYHGHNNRRLYQKELSIKKEQRELGRALVNGLSCVGRTFRFLIINAILCFVHKNREAEMKQQAIELKIVNETQRVQKQIAYNKRKQQRQDKRNELIDQWFKHMSKFVNGKYITVSLDEYTKMTDKQRKEWNGE